LPFLLRSFNIVVDPTIFSSCRGDLLVIYYPEVYGGKEADNLLGNAWKFAKVALEALVVNISRESVFSQMK
jgi:hypothetical protein